MAEVASAFVSIMPSARGFGSKLNAQVGPEVDKAGKSSGSRFGAIFAKAGAAGAALGIGAALKGSVGLEAQFSQTMNTIGAVTDVSSAKLAKLSDLALKMGADTVFSAAEASDAMLELAKGGMTAATIQAGGLAGTLKLAAAGGTDMETAATIASNAMNAFSLSGKDMNAVANALAGGANASSASVESLGEALSQVGPGAVNSGLSLQQTVAALSAFDAAGIKGSDAGTSLKTMLARLVPQTNKAQKAMEQLGLDFVKGNGEFESLTNIAGQLQEGLGGLTEAQRSQALTTIFGSDASRAAAVLMKEGEQGIRNFIKATQDQDAAQRVADARMKGTAGAIEQFKGSVETAQIELGLLFAPAIQAGLAKLTAGVNQVTPAMQSFVAGIKSGTGVGGLAATVFTTLGSAFARTARLVNNNRTAFVALATAIAAVVAITRIHAGVMAVQAAGGLLAVLKATKIVTAATKAYAAVQWLLNAALTANPIGIVIVALAALGAGLVIAYKKSQTFRNIVDGAFQSVKAGAQALAGFVTKTIPAAFTSVVDFVRGIPGKIAAIFTGAASIFYNAGVQLMAQLAAGITAKIGDAVAAAQAGLSRLKGLLPGSPIKWGPLKNWNNGGAGKRLMELVAKGITAATPKTVKAARSAFEKIQSSLESTRDNLRTTLDGLKGDFASIADSVSGAFTGNLFEASTAGDFIANLTAKKGELTGLLASFATLKGWGVPGAFLSQLFASGNGALITELAGMGQAGAVSAASLFGEVNDLGSQLGTAVAQNDPVAKRIDETNRLLTQVNKQLSYLGSDIGKELNAAGARAQRDRKGKGKK